MTKDRPVGRAPMGMDQLGRRGLITLFDQAVVSATNFLTSIIIARAVVKGEFGLYVLGFTILVFFTSIQIAVISTPYTFLIPRLRGVDHRSYSGSSLIHLFGLSCIATSFLVLGAITSSFILGTAGLPQILWILAAVVPLALLREYLRRFWFANLDVVKALVLDILVAFTQITGLIFLSYIDKLTVFKGMIWIGIATIIPSITLLIFIKNSFFFWRKKIWEDLGRNWSIARWISAEVLVRSASIQLYPWILAAFHGPLAAGIYGACIGPVLLANPVFIGTANFLAPNIAHQLTNFGVSSLRTLIRKITIVLVIFTVLFCLLMIRFGDRIVVLFYGAQYSGNGVVVGILALALMPTGCTLAIQQGLVALGRPDVGFKSHLLALAVTLTLGVWLVQKYGPLGVASGVLVGNLLASVMQYVLYRQILQSQVDG